MPTLLEVQRAVGRGVLADDDGEALHHIVADGLEAARLAVHRNNVVSNLSKALGLSYPAVHRLVGADFFAETARRFIAAWPPRTACLDDYGADLPEFLAGWIPAASLPYLADVARLEWAVNRALHAPDEAGLDLAALGDAAAEAGRLRFVPHPAVGLVGSGHPVDAIWRAVLERDDAALAAIELARPVWLIVERRAGSVEVEPMSASEWRFAHLLIAGATLQAALDQTGAVDAEARLAGHLARGRFVGFRLDPAPPHEVLP